MSNFLTKRFTMSQYTILLLLVALTIVILPSVGYAEVPTISSENQTGNEDSGPWEIFSKSQVLKPVDIAFDSNDNMYVLHSANRIRVIDPTGKIISNWDTLTGFRQASGLEVDKDGNVFIISPDVNKIFKFDSSKKLVMTWPSDGKGQFSSIDGILGFDIDDNGNIYIADMAGSRILKIDENGHLVDTWGSKGKNESEFLNPKGVFVDELQNVYVAASNNYRIQKFDPDGKLIDLTEPIYDNHGIKIVPESIAVDSSGKIFVSNDDAKAHDTGPTYYGAGGNVGKIWELDSDGKIQEDWFAGTTIRGLEINHAGEIFAADMGTNQILHLKTAPKNVGEIPAWIKNNARWWSQGQIADADFVQGLQYLIKEKIMKIPETKKGEPSVQKIPAWVKTNADWWANGKISDNEFVVGIQYLIANGIMKI